jgi:hypothetical protein
MTDDVYLAQRLEENRSRPWLNRQQDHGKKHGPTHRRIAGGSRKRLHACITCNVYTGPDRRRRYGRRLNQQTFAGTACQHSSCWQTPRVMNTGIAGRIMKQLPSPGPGTSARANNREEVGSAIARSR